MTVTSPRFAVRPVAYRALVLVALLVVVADADARGGRRGGSSRSSSSSASARSEGSSHTINLRTSGSSSSSSDSSSDPSDEELPRSSSRMNMARGSRSKTDPGLTPEEASRLAALQEKDRIEQAEKAAARKAALEKVEAERVASEKAAAAKKAAEEKAKADQVAAAQQSKQREEAAVVSDVDRALQRAKADYPVLNTPEGKPVLARIMDRQKALAASGVYPSMAMVQAVADHESLLQAAARPQPVATQAAQVLEQAPAAQPQTMGGCRWVTPIQWSCK